MTPEDLAVKVENLKKKPISEKIKKRMVQFRELNKKGNEDWFSELCFCILTASCTAKIGMRIQESVGHNFLTLSEDDMAARLIKFGYRFPNSRAGFIITARNYSAIKEVLYGMSGKRARVWLVKHVKGLGWKESSHFLRNVGYPDIAIIDRHILRLMTKYGMIPRIPKNINRRFYLEYEERLQKVADQTGLTLAELDLYLWYMEKGEVLK